MGRRLLGAVQCRRLEQLVSWVAHGPFAHACHIRERNTARQCSARCTLGFHFVSVGMAISHENA